jgi:hypothetical protein
MSYRSLGSGEVTLRNYRPVGRRKGNISLSDPLAAGVSLTFINPASSVVLGYDLDLGSSAKLDFLAKRTKNWADGWLGKVREDQRAAKADMALIVSHALPGELYARVTMR